jgi:hypothetical protein
MDRDVSFERDNRHGAGQQGMPGGPGRDAGWPVLASLPRVGRSDATRRESGPSFYLESPAEAEAPLRVDFGSAGLGDPWPFAVDAAHEGRSVVAAPTTAPTVAPATTDPPVAFEGRRTSDTRPIRHYRIDEGSHSFSAGGGPHARRESESLSASQIRQHAALAPHMGAAATAALVISACLLYWLAAGRTGAGIDAAQPAELGAEWTPTGAVETQVPAPAPTDGLNPGVDVNAQASAPIADAPAAARVADASASTASADIVDSTSQSDGAIGAETTGPVEAPAANIEGPVAPVVPVGDAVPADAATSAGPSLGPPAMTHEVRRAPTDAPTDLDDDPIGPTAQGDSYPTTSYPPFSFDAQAIAQAPETSAHGAGGASDATIVR